MLTVFNSFQTRAFSYFACSTYLDAPVFNECDRSLQRCVTPGLYAMVGAAAVLGGVTRMTGEFSKLFMNSGRVRKVLTVRNS